MAITSPPAGTKIILEQPITVSWDSIEGSSSYRLLFSFDGGSSFAEVANNILAQTYAIASVSAACSNWAFIRIEGYDASSTLKDHVDQSVIFLPALTKGDKGDKGDTGATGATGATGPAGKDAPLVQIGSVCSDANNPAWKRTLVNGAGGPGTELGTREWNADVSFVTPYASSPMVCAGFSHIDTAVGRGSRFHLDITDVKKTGFKIHFVTWGDTMVYGGMATWIAVGDPAASARASVAVSHAGPVRKSAPAKKARKPAKAVAPARKKKKAR